MTLELIAEKVELLLRQSEYVTAYTVGNSDYARCAIEIVHSLYLDGLLIFTENENGGKKDSK